MPNAVNLYSSSFSNPLAQSFLFPFQPYFSLLLNFFNLQKCPQQAGNAPILHFSLFGYSYRGFEKDSTTGQLCAIVCIIQRTKDLLQYGKQVLVLLLHSNCITIYYYITITKLVAIISF